MDSGKITLLIHTIKYLRFKQIYFRLYYYFRNKFLKTNYTKSLKKDITPLVWENSLLYHNSYSPVDNTFTFLNLPYKFKNSIDWNYSQLGKLWTYNLNYFDFLNQENIGVNQGVFLIEDFLKNNAVLKDGKESYTISLRGINWIKFLSKNQIYDAKINQELYNHYQILSKNIEYHLLGNHVLENGFSLLFGAYYFKDTYLFKKSKLILETELKEQILGDGAHFELSPMYQLILLHRLLDCIKLIQLNNWKGEELLDFLQMSAERMLSWLEAVTYDNGNIPMVNDSTYNIAFTSNQLYKYAKELNLEWKKGKLSDSGYRKLKKDNFELFVDVGDVGPDYQPAHAHSDTFNFELYKNDEPIVVDVGVSTYEKNEIRQQERSTESHNTVKIGNQNQTKVWGGFRVAERAKVKILKDDFNAVKASHNGYKKLGILHSREFEIEDKKIIIQDSLSNKYEGEQMAFLHFHPHIKKINILDNKLNIEDHQISFSFEKGFYKIEEDNYNYSWGFNKTEKAKKFTIFFKQELTTKISI